MSRFELEFNGENTMNTAELTALIDSDQFAASARDTSQRFANAMRCNAPLTPSQSKWSFFDLLCLKNMLTASGVDGEPDEALCRRYIDQITHSHPLEPKKTWTRKDQVAVTYAAADLLHTVFPPEGSITASNIHMPIPVNVPKS
jgi:hypothetical protein